MKSMTWLLGPALCIPLLAVPALAADQGAAGGQEDGGAPNLGTTPVDGESMALLRRMGERLAQAKGFGVSIRAGYDVVQDSGQKIEFGEERKVLLSRPGGLRVEVEQSDGDRRLIFFDGKTLTVSDPDLKAYAQLERMGTVDDAVRYLVRDLQVRVPLALLFSTTLPTDLERRIQTLDYVEQDRLTEVPTDHLAGRTADVDFQLWIAGEGEPLPRRIVITYKHEEGQPQFWALFSDWNLSPVVSDSQFAFEPPEGAERIPFVVRVAKDDAAGTDKSEPKGGAQ